MTGPAAGSTRGPDSGYGGVNRCPPHRPTCKQDGRRWSTGVKGHGRCAVLRTLDAGAVAPP